MHRVTDDAADVVLAQDGGVELVCRLAHANAPDRRESSVARPGTAYAFIGKTQAAHFLGVEDVAQVDDPRLAHRLLQPSRIEAAEVAPFGDADQHIGRGRPFLGSLGELYSWDPSP